MKPFASIFKQKAALGLDLGNTWAKAVKLSESRSGPVLEKIGRMSWTRSDWENQNQTALKLREFWEKMEFQDTVVVSSMAGHAVIIKRVTFSAAKARGLEENIHEEAKQYIPFDIDDVYLDYQIMGEGQGENSVDVVLVASKKKMVQDLQDVLERAGLGLAVVDVDAFALSNCFEFSYPELLEESTYLLDVGAQHSIFCVYSGGQPLFLREVGFGGQQITDRLAKALGKNRLEAEKVKINGPKGLDDEQQALAQGELDTIYNTWTLELQRLIDFYQGTVDKPRTAKRLFLAGGGSLMSGLTESFSSRLGIETAYMDPWRKIVTREDRFDPAYLESVGPQFCVAIGLALREVG